MSRRGAAANATTPRRDAQTSPYAQPSTREDRKVELERFRTLARVGSDGEPYRSLEAMLNIADRGGAYIAIQRRPWEGIKNYGEVLGFRNRADGDRWDIFVPGLDHELEEGEPLRVRAVPPSCPAALRAPVGANRHHPAHLPMWSIRAVETRAWRRPYQGRQSQAGGGLGPTSYGCRQGACERRHPNVYSSLRANSLGCFSLSNKVLKPRRTRILMVQTAELSAHRKTCVLVGASATKQSETSSRREQHRVG
jgi:hypothetical protein